MADRQPTPSPSPPPAGWLERLAARGAVREVSGRDRLPLSGSERVYLVLEGALDLFAVRRQDDAGRRRHIRRLPPGVAAWPVAVPAKAGAFIVAVPVPGTLVLELTLDEVCQEAARGPDALVIRELYGVWLNHVARAVWPTVPEEVSVQALEPGEVSVPDGAVVVPEASMVWLVIRSGRLRFGRRRKGSRQRAPRFEPPGEGVEASWLPLAAPGWARAEGDSTLTVLAVDDAAVWVDPTKPFRLGAALVTAMIAMRSDELERAEREADESRRATDGQAWHSAFSQLSGVLSDDRGGQIEPEVGREPLWAAMEVVAEHLGLRLQDAAAPRGAEVGDRVRALARASDIPVRQVALKGDWWLDDVGPMVAFRERDRRPLALLPRRRGGYIAVDPTTGARARVGRRLAEELEPFGWMLYRPFPPEPLGTWDLWRFGTRGVGRDLWAMLLIGALAGIVGLVTPIATGLIFSDIIPGGMRSQLAYIAMGLGAAALANVVFELARGLAVIRVDTRFGAAVQAAVWDRLLSLPVRFFRDFSAGDLALRASAVDQVRQVLSASTVTVIVSGVFSSFNLVLLYWYDPRLAGVATGLVVLALAVALGAAVLQLGRAREAEHWRGQVAALLMQLLAGVAKLRVAGAERRAFAQWARAFTRQVRASFDARRVANGVATFSATYPILAMIAIFAMVGTSSGAERMGTGDFLAFNAAFTLFLQSSLSLGGVAISALAALPAWERAQPILLEAPEADQRRADPGRLQGRVEVARVSFRYDDDGPLVLRNISLEIAPGESVALVGASGSGKSTLLRLLLGFETPTGGAIYYDGQDMERLDHRTVRQQLGVVLQNDTVLAGTLYSNIAGSRNIPVDLAWEAARMAALEAEIEALPMGMHTMLPEGGGTLSGGQRQRLMIARALVRKPPILYFDEATSALDNKSQAAVTKAITGLKATRIIIAHRLSTIRDVDRVVVLEQGELVEQGSYEELVAAGGHFAALVDRQLL